MDYAIVSVPAAPVRRKPMHRKEMVNQLLFGETVKVLKSKNELWVKIRSLHDNYEGWMTNTMLEAIDEDTATTRSSVVTTGLLSAVTVGDEIFNIPAGSSLPFFENLPAGGQGGKGRLGKYEYYFSGSYISRDEQRAGGELVKQLTARWLNVPYLWGGRSPLGIDCSGFVQVIFKLMGIDLPRDAWQQAQEGRPVKKFSQLQTGDLVFFDNKEDIVHVGIVTGNEQIIHASGKVRTDQINKKGIIHLQPGAPRTRLRAIRRYW